jgi:hypothetical protein
MLNLLVILLIFAIRNLDRYGPPIRFEIDYKRFLFLRWFSARFHRVRKR